MRNWYDKYMTVYGRSFSEIPQGVVEDIRSRLSDMQSDNPLISIVVIAYNEECRLTSCLWSLSHLQLAYPVEIIGVNNKYFLYTSLIILKSFI
jgi:hypothetical protein